MKTIRRYRDWKGNNNFYCNGYIMFGSDSFVFAFTNILLIAPSIGFFICVLPHMYYHIYITVSKA